jgi:hypothetical protein
MSHRRNRVHLTKAVVAAAIGALALVGLSPAAQAELAAAQAPDLLAPAGSVAAINTNSQDAVTNAFRNIFLPTQYMAPGWTGNTATCTVGNVSTAYQDATFTAINYFRAMAGVPGNLTENTTASAIARRTALILQAKGQTSASPPTSWPCWTNNGALTASISLLSRNSSGRDGYGAGPHGIATFVGDGGHPDNAAYRRFILSPGQQTFGSGSTNHVNVLVFSSSQSTGWNIGESPTFTITRSNTWSSPTFVVWPSKGYFPHQLLKQNGDRIPWSISTGSTSIKFTSATVAMTKNGTPISGITINHPAYGYGDSNTLVWMIPAGTDSHPAQGAVDTYHVKISGITGYSGGVYEYDVKVYDPAETTISSAGITGTAQVGSTLTATAGTRSPSDASLTYQWLRDGTAISGATGSTYVPAAADLGHQITVRVTPVKNGWTSYPKTSGAVTVQAGQFSAAPTPVVNNTAIVGNTMTISTGNWQPAGATLTYQWLRDGTAISGATGSTYKLTSADAGKTISVKVTATLAGYATTAKTSGGLKVTTPPGPYVPTTAWFTLTPDLNRDGFGEVLAIKAANGQLVQYGFTAQIGLATPVSLINSGLTGHRAYGPGDWNGDGKADVVSVDKSGYMWLYAGDGKGGIGSKVEIGHGWTPFRIIPSGDLNQDGANDMLAIDAGGRLWLYAGNGLGGFKGQPKQVGQGWVGLELYAAGDLNSDGKNDILAILPDSTLWAYSGRGNGTFATPKQVGRGWGAFELAAGADLNGDGRADIVGRNNKTGELWYYRGNGGGSFQAPKLIGTNW